MKITAISDEISYDFHTAFELGESWGLSDFEIRRLGPYRVPDHDPVWEEVVRQYVDNNRANITTISPGLFKLKRTDPETDQHMTTRFEQSIELAHNLNCSRLIIFAFLCETSENPQEPPEEILDMLRKKGDQAQKEGIDLAIETSQATFAKDGLCSGNLLEKLGHDAFSINWDPANALNGGDTSPLQGFEHIAGNVSQVHIKDTDTENIVTVGQGKIDWSGHLKALSGSGFNGFLSLETHQQPRLTRTKACLDALRKIAEPYL